MYKLTLASMSMLAASIAMTPAYAIQFDKPFTTPVLITNSRFKSPRNNH